jgi:hypothetical protein
LTGGITLIRTALTLSISAQDAQNTSYLVNGTHLGMLSSAPQNTHVQTNHRPLQLIVAIRNDDLAETASMVRQRYQINAWQDFLQILARHGSNDLSNLLHHYHLNPAWLICIDDHRLQAWLPAETGFYLLRQGELRRLRPAAPRDSGGPAADPLVALHYYALRLNQFDQYFLLPPALLGFFNPGEAAEVLLGLSQLPAKVSDLFNTARMRGHSEECSWLAMQILRLEEDRLPDSSRRKPFGERFPLLSQLIGLTRPPTPDESGSDSIGPAEADMASSGKTALPANPIKAIMASRWFPLYLGGGLLLLIVLIVVLVIGIQAGRKPSGSDPTLTSTAPTVTIGTPTPTPKITPTKPPTPTIAPPQLAVSARQLNLREEPNRNSKLLATLKTGDLLYQLAEPQGDWVKVKTIDGQTGYVYYSYVTAATTTG